MALAVSHDTEQLIFALAAAAEAKDHLSERHAKRVANTSWRLGRRLGLQESDLVALYRGGLLHDIGKIGVPDAILLKPGPLNTEHEMQMREHPVIGEEIVSSLRPRTFFASSAITTRDSTAAVTRTASPATGSPSWRGSCRSAMRTTRWRATALTGLGEIQPRRSKL